MASAMGVTIGTALGSATGWRGIVWFVAALGAVAALGITALPAVPTPPAIGLRRRLAPLGESGVATVLLATLLVLTGVFIVYTYVSLAYERATGGNGTTLAVLLFAFGLGAIVGNLGSGSLTDRLPSRSDINLAVMIGAVNYVLLPLSSAYLNTALVTIVVSGACGYAVVVPQQHRLIAISPPSAPLVIALNSSAVYIGVALSGPIGAAGIELVDANQLGFLATGLLAFGLLASEVAHRFSQPGKTQDAQVPIPAAKPESKAGAKAEEVVPPTIGEAAAVRPVHCEESIDRSGRMALILSQQYHTTLTQEG